MKKGVNNLTFQTPILCIYIYVVKTSSKTYKIKPIQWGVGRRPKMGFFRHQEGVTQPSLSEHIYIPSGENNTKYYYRKNGDNLEPLGKFTKLDMPVNQHRSSAFKGYLEYKIFFDRAHIISDAGDELYYTDEPPAAGSVPLTINDIPNIKGGKKYKKYRKNTKKYRKNTKKYRKTINKKRRLK
jgi:hypothetical protein